MISSNHRKFLISYFKKIKIFSSLKLILLIFFSIIFEAFFIKSLQTLIVSVQELNFQVIINNSLISLIFIVICGGLKIIQTKYYARYAAYIGKLICNDCLTGYFGSNLNKTKELNSNDLINSITIQSNYITRGVILASLNLITYFFTSLAITIVLLSSLGFSTFITIIITILLYILIAKKNKKQLTLLSKKQVEFINNLTNQIIYLINNKKKVFLNRENIKVFKKAFKLDSEYRDFLVSTYELAVLPKFYVEITAIITLLVVLIILALTKDTLIISKVGLLFFGILRLLPNFQNLYYGWAQINANTSQIDSFIKYKNSFKFKINKAKKSINRIEIIFKDKKLITLKKGESLCISGKSGCGKTKLLDLICNLNNKKDLKVKFFSSTNKLIDKNDAKSEIAFVEQDVFLQDETIKNIIFNNQIKDTSKAELNFVVKTSNLEELLHSDFWDKKTIGTSGGNLSGGQKQKVAISEAIVWNPSVIILDEATSGIDKISEQKIWSELLNIDDLIIIATTHNQDLYSKFDKVINIEERKEYNFVNN